MIIWDLVWLVVPEFAYLLNEYVGSGIPCSPLVCIPAKWLYGIKHPLEYQSLYTCWRIIWDLVSLVVPCSSWICILAEGLYRIWNTLLSLSLHTCWMIILDLVSLVVPEFAYLLNDYIGSSIHCCPFVCVLAGGLYRIWHPLLSLSLHTYWRIIWDWASLAVPEFSFLLKDYMDLASLVVPEFAYLLKDYIRSGIPCSPCVCILAEGLSNAIYTEKIETRFVI